MSVTRSPRARLRARGSRVTRTFARLTTDAVVRAPWAWPVFRRPLRWMFDMLAPRWDADRSPDRTRALAAGLDTVRAQPRRALDLGTGTGDAAFEIARRWPAVEVLGVDLSKPMVEEARAKTPPDVRGRVRFSVADARRLTIPDAAFDLVTLNNMIPFVSELARITAPAGHVVIAFSDGPRTPIYVTTARLRRELERHGFDDVREFVAGPGEAVVARRRREGAD